MKKVVLLLMVIAVACALIYSDAYAQTAGKQPESKENAEPGYGYGYGMMGPGYGYGYGMGPGMMGPGYGYGMGPGMMGPGYGYGMGPGMMGPGYGYGMGPGMMGGYGPGWQGYGYSPEMQKFLDETKDLRKELLNKQHDYFEAMRNPKTTPQELKKLQDEIQGLQSKIYEKAPRGYYGY